MPRALLSADSSRFAQLSSSNTVKLAASKVMLELTIDERYEVAVLQSYILHHCLRQVAYRLETLEGQDHPGNSQTNLPIPPSSQSPIARIPGNISIAKDSTQSTNTIL